MSKPTCDIMRDWASAYGAAVQQRIVRQETTMAKAWYSSRVHLSATMHQVRPSINITCEEAEQLQNTRPQNTRPLASTAVF